MTAEELLAKMWEAYAEQQCGWEDAASYHGHTTCSNYGVKAAGRVFEEHIPQLRDIMPEPKPDHFQSNEEDNR